MPVDDIIVVDGFSDDGTRDLASKMGAKIALSSGTQAAARNVGLALSKGDYVLFLDSDQELEPHVVEECVSLCERGAEAVKIPELFVGTSFWGKCSELWKNAMVRAWGQNPGIPRFFRREVLTMTSGFSGKMRFWEDLEFYHRVRQSGIRVEVCKARVIHYEWLSIRDLVRKYLLYGMSISVLDSASSTKAFYHHTITLTIKSIPQLMSSPGRSSMIFLGCLLQLLVKSLSALVGLLLAKIGGRRIRR